MLTMASGNVTPEDGFVERITGTMLALTTPQPRRLGGRYRSPRRPQAFRSMAVVDRGSDGAGVVVVDLVDDEAFELSLVTDDGAVE